jgi:hypothetical protein
MIDSTCMWHKKRNTYSSHSFSLKYQLKDKIKEETLQLLTENLQSFFQIKSGRERTTNIDIHLLISKFEIACKITESTLRG